ncbi:UNVERIFIED_CONTAM: hypothetical protein Sradi_0219200 [Sesamum radiatum]|uniref:Uncharacterized protein n=1 Tax=Sesamum radiatum TaxID=300843 RepID=A0AAW2W162_SESRA
MSAVKDHLVKHARREYFVLESTRSIWKVICNHSTPGFDIPYVKAWYSLKMAHDKVYGTWESSVRKLPRLMGAIQKWNPGIIVEWEHKGFQRSSGAYVIKYVFLAFKPCIEGFQFCRKVINVDGTHLYTKYKHKMLIAAAMDGNQQMVSKHIIRGMSGICLISDRHVGSWEQ